MRILMGVHFLFAKVPVFRALSIPFNDNRLCGCSKASAAEPFCIFVYKPFNERSRGCAFFGRGCAFFEKGVHFSEKSVHFLIIPPSGQKKAAKSMP